MLAAFSITPIGTGESLGDLVAETVRIVRASGLPNETNAMFTNIEGEWDEIMAVIKACVDTMAQSRAPRFGGGEAGPPPSRTERPYPPKGGVDRTEAADRRLSKCSAMARDNSHPPSPCPRRQHHSDIPPGSQNPQKKTPVPQ